MREPKSISETLFGEYKARFNEKDPALTELKEMFDVTEDVEERWGIIRQFYQSAYHMAHNGVWLNDQIPILMSHASPIEVICWSHIRHVFGIHCFYPQYPVYQFICDFAHPGYKIIIECDGREWHDGRKDSERDRILGQNGWRVFRIRGDQFYHDHSGYPESYRILREIKDRFFADLDERRANQKINQTESKDRRI